MLCCLTDTCPCLCHRIPFTTNDKQKNHLILRAIASERFDGALHLAILLAEYPEWTLDILRAELTVSMILRFERDMEDLFQIEHDLHHAGIIFAHVA